MLAPISPHSYCLYLYIHNLQKLTEQFFLAGRGKKFKLLGLKATISWEGFGIDLL